MSYHDHPARSSSEIAMFLDDPIEWWHVYKIRDWVRATTKQMKLGTGIHEMIEIGLPLMIARGGWESLVREIPREVLNADGHCKGKAYTDWAKENPAQIYFKPGQPNPFRQVWANLQASTWFRDVMEVGEREVEHFWTDSLLGDCRVKMDLAAASGVLVDWKSTSKKCARTFAADAYARHYDVRLALYVLGFRDKYGCEPEVYIGAINTSGGYKFTPYRMPANWLEEAEARLILTCEEMDTFDLARYLDVAPVPLEQPKYATFDLEAA